MTHLCRLIRKHGERVTLEMLQESINHPPQPTQPVKQALDPPLA
jgi:hypothetical protein